MRRPTQLRAPLQPVRPRGPAPRRGACCAASLVPQTLEEMASDAEFQQIQERQEKLGQREMTRREQALRQRSLDGLDVPPFQAVMKARSLGHRGGAGRVPPLSAATHAQDAGVSPLVRAQATILQLNIGLYCNQACTHCHVESSPKRTEVMDHATAERCVALLRASPAITTVDLTGTKMGRGSRAGSVRCRECCWLVTHALAATAPLARLPDCCHMTARLTTAVCSTSSHLTSPPIHLGGAPELNPEFRYLVREARAAGRAVIDRCNLTALLEPGQARPMASNCVQLPRMHCTSFPPLHSIPLGSVLRGVAGPQCAHSHLV